LGIRHGETLSEADEHSRDVERGHDDATEIEPAGEQRAVGDPYHAAEEI
jgi:hypothetical protein